MIDQSIHPPETPLSAPKDTQVIDACTLHLSVYYTPTEHLIMDAWYDEIRRTDESI